MNTSLAQIGNPEPNTMSAKQQSIFNSVLVVAASSLAIAYLLKNLPKEKSPVWGVVGWFALGGAWYGGLNGVSGILHHFSEKKEV